MRVCSTDRGRAFTPGGAICLAALFLLIVAACGPGLKGAKAAVERAELEKQKLEETNTPAEITVTFRMHLNEAQLALEKKRYRKAYREATEAERIAINILKNREEAASELKIRLEKLRKHIESQPRPTQNVVDAYFDAFEALENMECEKAAEIIVDIENLLLQRYRLTSDKRVIVSASDDYYRIHGFIPIYRNVSDEGETDIVIWRLTNNVRATFLGAKYISRELIFVHVQIEEPKIRTKGWVEKRFVR